MRQKYSETYLYCLTGLTNTFSLALHGIRIKESIEARTIGMKKILITDDALFMRAMLKGILTGNQYEVIEAANGQEAIDQYDVHQPDLVLMDITMPVMDGLTAVRTIKGKHPGARLVMCSSMGQQSTVIEALRAGASDFIVKPFQPQRVLDCVSKVLC